MTRDYGKDQIESVSYDEAMDKAREGWVVLRRGWPRGLLVFLAREANFTAVDLITGRLEPFMVQRVVGGAYHPWQPSPEDLLAHDWTCLTRQTIQRLAESDAAESNGRHAVRYEDRA